MALTHVVVGCKLPNGLIIGHGGTRVHLNGANSSRIIGGYGMTRVEISFWEAWKKSSVDFEPLKRGVVFVQKDEDAAEEVAEDQKSITSGFEAIDPKRIAPGVEAVTVVKA